MRMGHVTIEWTARKLVGMKEALSPWNIGMSLEQTVHIFSVVHQLRLLDFTSKR